MNRAHASLVENNDDSVLSDVPSAASAGKQEDSDDDAAKTPASFGVLPRHHMSAKQGNLASEAAKKKAERLRY